MTDLANRILVDLYDCFESAEDKAGEHLPVESVTNIRYAKDEITEAPYVLVMDKKTKKIFKLLAPVEVHRKHLTADELDDVVAAEECIDDNAEWAKY